MNEREKMMAGQWYDANFDQTIIEERLKAKDLCFELDHTKPSHVKERLDIIEKIVGYRPEGIDIKSPFMVDYGVNIEFGENVDINHNCYFMDGGKIRLGDNVFVGPFCGFYTANHPLEYRERNLGLEQAGPITVGNNVWFGANVTVMPNVSIGSGSVIGAGSVVTKDVPENSLAVGNPCKVIKLIENK